MNSLLLNIIVQKMKQEDKGMITRTGKKNLNKINYLTEEILLKMEKKRLSKIKEVVTPRKRVCKKDPNYYYY